MVTGLKFQTEFCGDLGNLFISLEVKVRLIKFFQILKLDRINLNLMEGTWVSQPGEKVIKQNLKWKSVGRALRITNMQITVSKKMFEGIFYDRSPYFLSAVSV